MRYIFKLRTKVLLFFEKAFANRTNILSNRTKVTDYITACEKIDVQTQKSPRFNGSRGWGEGENVCLFVQAVSV